jgi:hypothetical protein
MFYNYDNFRRLVVGAAVASALAVVAVQSASAAPDTWYPAAVALSQQHQQSSFVTDTLGSLGHGPTLLATTTPEAQVNRFTSDPSGPTTTPSTTGVPADIGAAIASGSIPASEAAAIVAQYEGSRLAGLPSATKYNPRAYVPGGASPTVAQAIQTLGHGTSTTVATGGGPAYTPEELNLLKAYSKASLEQKKAMLAGVALSTAGDYIEPSAGNFAASQPRSVTTSPSTVGGGGTSFDWGDAAIGLAIGVGLVLLLLTGSRFRPSRRRVLAT